MVNTSPCHGEEHRFKSGTGRHPKGVTNIIVAHIINLGVVPYKRRVVFRPLYRDIVQLVERWSGGPEVVGSSPTISTTVVSTAITSMFRWKSGPVLGFLLGNQYQKRNLADEAVGIQPNPEFYL